MRARAQVAKLVAALREIAAGQPKAPDYDKVDDTESAEAWGVEQGHYEAGRIARRALRSARIRIRLDE